MAKAIDRMTRQTGMETRCGQASLVVEYRLRYVGVQDWGRVALEQRIEDEVGQVEDVHDLSAAGNLVRGWRFLWNHSDEER